MAAAPIMAGAAHEAPWTAAALVEKTGVEVVVRAPLLTPVPAGAVPDGATAEAEPLVVGYGAVAVLMVVGTAAVEVGATAVVVATTEEVGTTEAVTDAVGETTAVDDGTATVRVTPAPKQRFLAKARVVAMSAASQAASTSLVTVAMNAELAQIQAMLPAVQPGTVAVARPVTMVAEQVGRPACAMAGTATAATKASLENCMLAVWF